MKFVRIITNDTDRKQAIFEMNGNYFLYSYVNNGYAHETMVFSSNETGDVVNYSELAVVKGHMSTKDMMKGNVEWVQ